MFWCSAAGWSVLLDLFFAHLQRKLVDDPSIFYEMWCIWIGCWTISSADGNLIQWYGPDHKRGSAFRISPVPTLAMSFLVLIASEYSRAQQSTAITVGIITPKSIQSPWAARNTVLKGRVTAWLVLSSDAGVLCKLGEVRKSSQVGPQNRKRVINTMTFIDKFIPTKHFFRE